jgi:hypothetical protein
MNLFQRNQNVSFQDSTYGNLHGVISAPVYRYQQIYYLIDVDLPNIGLTPFLIKESDIRCI